MSISKWSGVAVALGSIGTARTIADITKANPAVVYHSGAVLTSGDYVALTSVLGMSQVNNRAFRLTTPASVSPGPTAALENENSTAYDTFTSGQISPITFSYSMSTGTSVTASGGDFDFADTTTIHDLQRSQIPNISSPLTYSFDCFWDPSDTFLTQVLSYTRLQTLVALRLTFTNTYKFLVLGYVAASLAPTGSQGEVVKTPVTFTAFGLPTLYTS
jgi:hypothetical protein